MGEGKLAGVGDAAVRARTGKSWAQWFALLDRAGGRALSHKEIVAVLRERHAVGDWWQQMIAVAYEQSRGLRAPHQSARGFQVSVSRTLAVPLERLYRAWSDPRRRARWLPEAPLRVRKATPDKSLRIAWKGGESAVDVSFYARGPAKSQVTVMHSKLSGARQVERMRAYWAGALEALRHELGGKGKS